MESSAAVHRLPEPASASDQVARDSALAEISLLELDDLLALCERYRPSPPRLRRYLAVVRARYGARAQFAAAMVCFDLASGGSASAQREFQALVPSLLAVGIADQARLLGDCTYLAARWRECREVLDRGDPREVGLGELALDAPLQLELFAASERAELPPIPPPPEGETARQRRVELGRLLDRQLGIGPHGVARAGASAGGFDTSSGAALDQFERFLQQVERLASDLAAAQGLRSVGQLFLATHLRRHTWFGRINPRRVRSVRGGLRAFVDATSPPAAAASIFEFAGENVAERFQKLTELLLDFIDWCARARLDPMSQQAIDGYVAADRQPPAFFVEGTRRRRR